MKFLFNVFTSLPFFLSFFLFLFPTLAPLSLFSSATKQTRKTSLCHVFRLDFLPAQKHSRISLVLSQRTSLSPLSARSKKPDRGSGGNKKRKEKKGGTTSRSLVGEHLRRNRWATVISFSYSNYTHEKHTKERIEMRGFHSLWTMYTEGPEFHHILSKDTRPCSNTLGAHCWFDMVTTGYPNIFHN